VGVFYLDIDRCLDVEDLGYFGECLCFILQVEGAWTAPWSKLDKIMLLIQFSQVHILTFYVRSIHCNTLLLSICESLF